MESYEVLKACENPQKTPENVGGFHVEKRLRFGYFYSSFCPHGLALIMTHGKSTFQAKTMYVEQKTVSNPRGVRNQTIVLNILPSVLHKR